LGAVLDVVPVLHASDVYVMPSLYEGCPIAAIEAMGAGLPVIFSDVPGLRDFREAGEGICWVEPTTEPIYKAMLSFIDMPTSRRRELGLRLSKYAHGCFAIDKGAEAYAQLYRGERVGKSSRASGYDEGKSNYAVRRE
jgi:glycosyltransferase involved in cell wall biosynthesis